jgi:hypothetical protein
MANPAISVFCCTLSYFLAAPVLVSSFETGRISQVLTTAVVLVMACPHEIYVLQVLSGGGVAALNARYIVSACSNRSAPTATPASNLLRAHQCGIRIDQIGLLGQMSHHAVWLSDLLSAKAGKS